jgi:hypothetical protein
MAKYIYKGQEVQLVPGQQFSHGWYIYYNQPTEDGGNKKVQVLATPPGEPGANLRIVDDDTVITSLEGGKKNEEIPNPESVNINQVSFTEMHKSLPGIGRAGAKKILANKPSSGYQDIEELKELNSDLAINWDELKEVLVF